MPLDLKFEVSIFQIFRAIFPWCHGLRWVCFQQVWWVQSRHFKSWGACALCPFEQTSRWSVPSRLALMRLVLAIFCCGSCVVCTICFTYIFWVVVFFDLQASEGYPMHLYSYMFVAVTHHVNREAAAYPSGEWRVEAFHAWRDRWSCWCLIELENSRIMRHWLWYSMRCVNHCHLHNLPSIFHRNLRRNGPQLSRSSPVFWWERGTSIPCFSLHMLHEKLQEIGQQLLEAYFNGQLEAPNARQAETLEAIRWTTPKDRCLSVKVVSIWAVPKT